MSLLSPLRRLAISIAFAAALQFPAAAIVSAEDGAITVSGAGEVMAKPTRIEIDVRASGNAELTSDAIIKYRTSERTITDAFKGLNLAGLEVQPRTLSIGTGGGGDGMAGMAIAIGGPGGAPAAKAEFSVTRVMRIVLKDIGKLSETELVETIGTLLDTAKDNGAVFGDPSANAMARFVGGNIPSNSAVSYVVENADEIREAAYQQAFDQAEARAKRLAKLSKTRLGPVLSVEETVVATNESSLQEKMVEAVYGIASAAKDESRLSSDKLADIPVRVNLRVKFAILPGEKKSD